MTLSVVSSNCQGLTFVTYSLVITYVGWSFLKVTSHFHSVWLEVVSRRATGTSLGLTRLATTKAVPNRDLNVIRSS